MTPNDILRRLRYALGLDDKATCAIYALTGYEMAPEYLRGLMKKDDEPGYIPCRDKVLDTFLNGLIIKHRGPADPAKATPAAAESEVLSNNTVLKKLRVALTLKDTDILNLLKMAGFYGITKTELTALFRQPDHRNFKPCGDQLLRNFMQGLSLKNRPEARADKEGRKAGSVAKKPAGAKPYTPKSTPIDRDSLAKSKSQGPAKKPKRTYDKPAADSPWQNASGTAPVKKPKSESPWGTLSLKRDSKKES